MTLFNFLLVLLTELCSVTGQLLFKHALGDHARAKMIRIMTAGIAVKALDFFLWIGLLSKYHLSYIYPFDGLNRILLALGATIFLKEKISRTLWLGVLLITAGLAIVSATDEQEQVKATAVQQRPRLEGQPSH